MDWIDLSRQTDAARDEVARNAAESLRAGGVALLPTDTVYAFTVAANPGSPSLERLRAAVARRRLGGPGTYASTWHAPSPERVIDVLRPTSALHRRIVRRLLPGPVRLEVELGSDAPSAVHRAGAAPGAIERDGVLFLRVPDHPVFRAVAAEAGCPLVAERAALFGWGDGRTITRAPAPDADAAQVAVDDGPTRYGKISTVLRLTARGGYALLSEGALESRHIRRRLDRAVLLVCTGNTCRSPMAEAIGRSVQSARRDTGFATRFSSAGTSASDGQPASAEAVEAMREQGLDLSAHRSRALTRAMIADAEAIFTMTPAHARAVLAIDPAARDKVQPLDPEGGEVPDPIGQGLEVYRATAARIAEMISYRLDELDRA